MTKRRMTTDPGAAHDALVRETYRDIARESAPEHLNRAVLDAAASEARPRYSRLRLWTRPAAWAAVVMLSVAILIETNQAPMPESVSPMAEQDELRQQELAESEWSADTDPKAESPMLKSDAGAADVQQLKVRDEDLVDRAEEMARMREGRRDEPAPAAASRAVASPQEEAPASVSSYAPAAEEPSPACDEMARATPESWLECIVELEESEELDAARMERELLAEAFPDFDTP